VINLSPVPCPDGYVVIHEPAWLELIDQVRALVCDQPSTANLSRALGDLMSLRNPAVKESYICPSCERLLVIDRATDSFAAAYRREQGDSQAFVRRAGTGEGPFACPSCGNQDPENMVFVRHTRNAHRMRWARSQPNPSGTAGSPEGKGTIEVELERVSHQKILGDVQIECRRCYVVFDWPEDVQFLSLHPCNWDPGK
jgi:uncharacterized C2H2 Zn-finger protein